MRIGIMSFAHIHAESYAEVLLKRKDVDFIGFYDDDYLRGKEMAGRFGIKFFDNEDEFFSEAPEAVIICSENARHRSFVETAADHGCSILCEKPLATSVEDAGFIVEKCREKKLLLMTAFPMRYAPPVVEAKKAVETDKLGQIFCVSSSNQGRLPRNLRSWFIDKELAGGGALSDHLVHLTDIFRWIFKKEVAEVYARVNNNLYPDDAGIKVETGGFVMLSLKDGPFITVDCSWSRPEWYPTWGGLNFKLIGEKGNLIIDAFKQNLQYYPQSSNPEWRYWGSNADWLMIDDFIISHRTGKKPVVSGEDGLRAVEVVQAAYRSAESGKPVKML